MRFRSLIIFGFVAGLALWGSDFVVHYLKHRLKPAARTPEVVSQSGAGIRAPASPEKPGGSACVNIYRMVCQKHGETRDPTGFVQPDLDGEVEALRVYQDIIHDHPQWTSEQVDEALVETIYTPKLRKRLQSAYRWVQRAIVRFINRQPDLVFNSWEKRQIIKRVRNTKLELPPPASAYADEPDLFTKNDVFYERSADGTTRMRVGGAYLLASRSWFNLLFTLGHELGHSIDPCEMKSVGLMFPAYHRLESCFLRTGLIAAPKGRVECGDNDQLSETFADWVAVHVIGDALKTFSTEFRGQQVISAATNSVRDLCEQDDDLEQVETEYHPAPKVRIERIFGNNPTIREILGCGAPPLYCEFDSKPFASNPREENKNASQ